MALDRAIRVGIVGARFAGEFHYESILGVRGVPIEIVGVTSKRPESREKFAAARGIKAFDTVEELIEASDVVDVCTPTYVHEEIAVQAANAGRDVIVEKPFTGSFLNRAKYEAGDKRVSFNEQRYAEAVGSARRMADAVRKNDVVLCFAENWHFLPCGLKTCRLMMRSMFRKTQGADGKWALSPANCRSPIADCRNQKSEINNQKSGPAPDPGARVLLIRGNEAHSGSTSAVYGDLRFMGGGSIVGKGCHPLGFALYLKRLEGIVRDGTPIAPVAVSGRCGYLTSDPSYRDPDYQNPRKVRRGYVDGEDWGLMVVRFADGTFAEIESNEFTLGGVANSFEVLSNKFRVRANISPNDALQAYSPSADVLEPEYIIEKLETAGGWSYPATNENLTMGYIEEMQVFFERFAARRAGRAITAEPPYFAPDQDLALAVDSVRVMYGAYVSDERGGAEVALDELDALGR